MANAPIGALKGFAHVTNVPSPQAENSHSTNAPNVPSRTRMMHEYSHHRQSNLRDTKAPKTNTGANENK